MKRWSMQMYPRTFSGLAAVQVKDELEHFIKIIVEQDVRSYLEIGCGRGDTFHEIVSHLPKGSRAMAVDLPDSGWGFNDSRKQLIAACEDLSRQGYDVRCLFGDSKGKEMIDAVNEVEPFDLVFIDGDHTLAGVTADWENYGGKGKMTAFHDIADTMMPNGLKEVIEVPRFWKGLKRARLSTTELIAQNSTMGIGIIMHAYPRP